MRGGGFRARKNLCARTRSDSYATTARAARTVGRSPTIARRGPPNVVARGSRAALYSQDQLPPLAKMPGLAPVLQVPHVFEPELCRTLIQTFEAHGGRDIGTLQEVNGRVVRATNNDYKRRTDYEISDPEMIAAIHGRLAR